MRLFFENETNPLNIWSIYGSFGALHGAVSVDGYTAECQCDTVKVKTVCTSSSHGVISRVTTVMNTSDAPITFSELADVFPLEGGEYEAYTQYNGWQSESIGSWNNVGTEIAAQSEGFRTNFGAVPFTLVWSRQANRGMAFHIVPDSAWEIHVRRVCDGNDNNHVRVIAGINSRDLSLTLESGESITLPEILYYPVSDRVSMDAWKLQRYLLDRMPRREMPVMYNTWLAFFDKLSFENVESQIAPAASLGAEYFVIDAGWFGNGDSWTKGRGDWTENMVSAFCGRMRNISAKVRENGMKFGIWLELETADDCAEIFKIAPDMFINTGNGCLLDFANPEAVQYAFDTVKRLVEEYNAGFFKLDFNSSCLFDERRVAFSEYMNGFNTFLKKVRAAYPELYIERCSSGGFRMNIADARFCDSYWLSDDQNPQAGVRIIKDTVRRIPSQWIERWATVCSLPAFQPTYSGKSEDKLLATDDAIWHDVRSVQPSFLNGFLTGGPIGFSCDLTKLTPDALAQFKDLIAAQKADNAFFAHADCRVLCDTETAVVLQYNDRNFERAELVVYSFRSMQHTIRVFPQLDILGNYMLDGEIISAETLTNDGIPVIIPGRYGAVRITLTKQK